MVTILPFRVKQGVCLGCTKVDEEQSTVTFLVPPFFSPSFFHVSKFKSHLVCMLNEMNQIIKEGLLA